MSDLFLWPIKHQHQREDGMDENVYLTLVYHMEKADFLYFEVEDPKGTDLIMFRESSMTFSAKMR